MNKSELVGRVAELTETSNAVASRAVDAFIGAVTETLKKGDTVVVTGFGTFSVKNRPARMGRNPQTNQPMKINASKAPAFKPGKVLKDAIK